MTTATKPKLAVWKFASCDGCQLTLLDLEDELLDIVGVSLVEGSVTTAHDAKRIKEIRAKSRTLVSIGACATAGGVQALKNFANVEKFISIVYANPAYIDTLATSTAIEDHVEVDFELRGCPISKHQLLETVDAFLHGRRPNTPAQSVCIECKLRGTQCIMVAGGTACMGPVTQAGCRALCPAYNRGCFGCFGPAPNPNIDSLREIWHRLGVDDTELVRALRTFNAFAPEFEEASRKYDS